MKAANNQIVENVNNGITINKIYYSWCKIKNEVDYRNWQIKAGSVRFGTYKTDSIFDVINNFNTRIKIKCKNPFANDYRVNLCGNFYALPLYYYINLLT